MMPVISVIVPVYNAEDYLTRCVDSIMAQTFTDFELILVNDGSSDHSGKICDEYAAKDNRVVVVHKENGGVSSARNTGLDIATGSYIAFVDSDDFVEPDYFEQIDHVFESTEAQIVFIGVEQIDIDTGTICVRNVPELPQSMPEQIVALTKADMFGYTWIKAISRQLIGNIRFDESLNLFEDEVFTCEIMQKNPVIASVGKPIYHQFIVSGSLSRKTHPEYFRKCDAVYNAWKKLLQSSEKMHPVLQEKANHMANVCKYYYLEKKVPANSFVKGLANCAFFQEATVEDPLIVAIQKRRFVFARTARIAYRTKVFLRKAISW